MDDPRIAVRAGSEGAPVIKRFVLYGDVLAPGGSCDAKFVIAQGSGGYKTITNSNMLITVWSTFYRCYGLQGEYGWAKFNHDNHKWEVISMEGSLMRHGKASGTVTAISGSTPGGGSVTIYEAAPSTETSSGQTVTARNLTQTSFTSGQYVMIWFEPFSQKWYVLGGGTPGSGGGSTVFEAQLESNLNAGDSATNVYGLLTNIVGVTAPSGMVAAFNDLELSGLADDYCYVIQNNASLDGMGNPTYELIAVTKHPETPTSVQLGTLGGTLLTTTTTVAISGVTGCTTAANDMGYAAASGAACYVAFDGTTWRLIGVKQTKLTYVSNVALTAGVEVQTKLDIIGMDAANSTTSTVWTGVTCPSGD